MIQKILHVQEDNTKAGKKAREQLRQEQDSIMSVKSAIQFDKPHKSNKNAQGFYSYANKVDEDDYRFAKFNRQI